MGMGDRSQTSHAEDFRTKAGLEGLWTAFSLHYSKEELWAPGKIHLTVSMTEQESIFNIKCNNSVCCFLSLCFICLGGSRGSGYRWPGEWPPRERRASGALLCPSQITHMAQPYWPQQWGCKAVFNMKNWASKNWAPIYTKIWLNTSNHVKTIWQMLLYIFCTEGKKVIIIYSICLKGHLL